MGDFYQNGIVTTLHNLVRRPVEDLEAELMEFRKARPMSLVLPSLYSELEGPALKNIVHELTKVPYLDQIVIGLDRANEEQYRHALEYFSELPQNFKVLWNDGPRLRDLDLKLREQNLAPTEMGKGRNVWYCFGYVLASGVSKSVALHDCDILTYSRDLVARLIYPVANPGFNYMFCKGYYARVADGKMNGRVSRLLVTPLIRALKKVCGPSDFLDYLDSYRYPLAGEFSFRTDVINDLRIPSDWGLEVGVLSEMKRNYATNRLCQVDIADVYDHKHQELSAEDASRGLSKMSMDISKALFRKLATNGEIFSSEKFRTIKASYFRIALDFVETYQNDAIINGLTFDRHKEEKAVELFAQNVMRAGAYFLDNPMDTPFIPSWNRVTSAIPDIKEQLLEAVELDNQEFRPMTQVLKAKLESLLTIVYPDLECDGLADQLLKTMGLEPDQPPPPAHQNNWNEADVVLITYADSVQQPDEKPLVTLHQFLTDCLEDSVSTVHILPFFPFSSDDGFSVMDYLAVNESHGTWEHVEGIAADFKLMADLVINHMSARSRWFENFRKRVDPGKDYFFEGNPRDDLSAVVRPRTSPLLNPVQTEDGERHVWCTFSEDQVDLNFANPQVLIEFTGIIRQYLERGVIVFRLDAVAFLWKEPGTSCIHLQQTHELIKILRLLIEHHSPSAVVITETNVPNRENLTYFGNANEAHVIYNFSLPPLLINTLVTGNCRHLKTWLMSMPPAQMGTTYLNFIASHDGIGMRPTDGLLSEEEKQRLINTMDSFGGKVSYRRTPDGRDQPYEINIALYDALKGTAESGADHWQFQRFICAHTVMLALEGIPAFYIHSLLATENDLERVENTGRLRSINRSQWQLDELEQTLADPLTHHSKVFHELQRLIAIRRKQPAFHPNATQFTLHLGLQLFGFWRQSMRRDQSIFCIHNISNEIQQVALSDINLIGTDEWVDLISGMTIDDQSGSITLKPYQSVWLSNRE